MSRGGGRCHSRGNRSGSWLAGRFPFRAALLQGYCIRRTSFSWGVSQFQKQVATSGKDAKKHAGGGGRAGTDGFIGPSTAPCRPSALTRLARLAASGGQTCGNCERGGTTESMSSAQRLPGYWLPRGTGSEKGGCPPHRGSIVKTASPGDHESVDFLSVRPTPRGGAMREREARVS